METQPVITLHPAIPFEGFRVEDFLLEASGEIATLHVALIDISVGLTPPKRATDQAVRNLILAYAKQVSEVRDE